MPTHAYNAGVDYAIEKLGGAAVGAGRALKEAIKVKPRWWQFGKANRDTRAIVNRMDDPGREALQNVIREGSGHELLQQRPEVVQRLRKAFAGHAADPGIAKQPLDWSRAKKGLGYGAAAGLVGGAAATPFLADVDDPGSIARTMAGGSLLGAGIGGALGSVHPLGRAIARAGAARRMAL